MKYALITYFSHTRTHARAHTHPYILIFKHTCIHMCLGLLASVCLCVCLMFVFSDCTKVCVNVSSPIWEMFSRVKRYFFINTNFKFTIFNGHKRINMFNLEFYSVENQHLRSR